MVADKFEHKYRILSARAKWHNYNEGDYFITICTEGREHYFGKIVDGEMLYNVLGQKLNQLILEIPTHNQYAEIPVYQIMPNHVHLIVSIDETKMKRDDADCTGSADCAGAMVGTDAVDDIGAADGIDVADGMDVADGTDVAVGTHVVDCTDVAVGTDATVGTDVADCMDAADCMDVADCRDAACHVSTTATTTTTTPTKPNAKMQEIAYKCGLLSTAIGGMKSALTKYAHTNKIEFEWQTRFHDHIIRDREEWNRIATYIANNPATWQNDKFHIE